MQKYVFITRDLSIILNNSEQFRFLSERLLAWYVQNILNILGILHDHLKFHLSGSRVLEAWTSPKQQIKNIISYLTENTTTHLSLLTC
jgi:hypothetical protein